VSGAVTSQAGKQDRILEPSQPPAPAEVEDLVYAAKDSKPPAAEPGHLRHERQPIETPGLVQSILDLLQRPYVDQVADEQMGRP
jgi:hypothetical protein